MTKITHTHCNLKAKRFVIFKHTQKIIQTQINNKEASKQLTISLEHTICHKTDYLMNTYDLFNDKSIITLPIKILNKTNT